MPKKLSFTARDLMTMRIIGATTGALVACVFIAARFSTDAGDILGFFGGAIGSGLAVIGALWLDERKTAANREASGRMLTHAMQQIALSAFKCTQAAPDEIAPRLLTFRQAVHTFETVRGAAIVDDATAYFSMSSIIYWMEVIDAEVKGVLNRLDKGELTNAQTKAAINPRMAITPQAIATTFGAHPYWGNAQSELARLLEEEQSEPAQRTG